jgi:hypothetical protein
LSVALLSVNTVLSQTGEFYEISRLPFTSDQSDEFAPAYFRQGLVFTTNRRTGDLISRLTDEGEVLYNIFFTTLRQSGRWATPGILARNLKSNYHDGPVSISPDGSRIFFTRNIPGRSNETSVLGIFMADYSDGEWINIRQFPFNSNNYNVNHPGISPDGKTLYFASDMPGGYGGMDIWSSEMQGNNWLPPVNLGEKINSAKDEVFPYFHSSGRLYFSSSNTLRNTFDLHYSNYNNFSWQTPVKLPPPFNSEADDFGFIADNDLTTGYFSSSREGTDNIYSFVSSFPVFTQCESIKEPGLCYDLFEASGGEIDTSSFYFEWDLGDGNLKRGKEIYYCFAETGTYLISLNVIDILSGEVSYSVVTHELIISKPEQPFINSPDTCFAGQHVIADASQTNFPDLEIDGFYWDMGDGSKYKGEVVNHLYTIPGIYEIRLGIITDPDSPFGQQRSCVYKNIVVLEN